MRVGEAWRSELVAEGHAKDVDEAVKVLVGRRAGIRLSAGQREVVARVVGRT